MSAMEQQASATTLPNKGPVMPRLYYVQTTLGPIFQTIILYAPTQEQAISTALELAGPSAKMLRAWQEGEW